MVILSVIAQSVVKLNDIIVSVIMQCCYFAQYRYFKCDCAEYCYAECHYSECYYEVLLFCSVWLF
jgi:hypothetical protein